MTHARRVSPPGRWRVRACLVLLVLPFLWPARAESAERPSNRREPHLGYAFPAGGQVGTTVKVKVGGQYLRNIEAAHVSGEGIRAGVVMFVPPAPNLDGAQRRELMRRMNQLFNLKAPAATGRRQRPTRRGDKSAKPTPDVKLPDNPLLDGLEGMDLDSLMEVARYFFVRKNPLQRKRSIEETVQLQIRIDPDAEPGIRELRLETKQGISNPITFRVGLLPEVKEREPFRPNLPGTAPVTPPVVLNGQILPRDTDRYRIRARKGQRLVFRAEARALVPYQADSVPGWMQATLTLFGPDGREVAYADEYLFDPDPVLYTVVPEDGEYVLEVQDAIHRGRDDFVYRVTVGELPFVTRVFPLGGQEGALTLAEVEGYNLHWGRVPLDTREGGPPVRQAAWRHGIGITNAVRYAVDDLREEVESEPNDAPPRVPRVALPCIVNGRIDRPGDVDLFAFDGRRGEEVVLEVKARVLGSPIDSVIRLLDAQGEVVAWNDDYVPEGLTLKALGLQTHHADSYLRAKLPKSGLYFARVADVRGHGSVDHAYRLRLSAPRPDVELYVTPSNVNVPAGRAALIDVHALRKDGFDGDIDLFLDGDTPEGFDLGGAIIPKGQSHVSMTLAAPAKGPTTPFEIKLRGRIRVRRQVVERPVLPADNVMQAFLWRHLVPAEHLAVCMQKGGGRFQAVALENDDPLTIRRGGKAKATFKVKGRVAVKSLRFEPIDPPAGIVLGQSRFAGNGFSFEVKAKRDAPKTGETVNLIVEAFFEGVVPARDRNGKPQKRAGTRWSRSLGLLPAIPIVVR